MVIGKRRHRCEIVDEQGTRHAGRLRGNLCPAEGHGIAVGDRVRARVTGADAVIDTILPRANQFTRRDPGARARQQVIAANLDQLLAVVAVEQPQPRWGLLDRILVTAEAAAIPPLIVATKAELWDEQELRRLFTPYEQAGYPVLAVSACAGRGLDAVRERLAGRVSLLVGASGVGKTTLIAALAGLSGLRTGAVSGRTGKGRHTTTESDAHACAGGWMIDTPGLRTFGLPELDPPAIGAAFPEVRAARDGCRFGHGCTHAHEPGCTVKEAVRAGRFDPRRYRSYLRLIGQDDGREAPAVARGGGEAGRRGGPDADFVCRRCGAGVPGAAPGSAHRNHCPACLWSRHVDHQPGDRAAGCEGDMEPVAVMVRAGGEWALIHRCVACGALRTNRIAGDDNGPLLLSLAARPLARPPFPLEHLVSVSGAVRAATAAAPPLSP